MIKLWLVSLKCMTLDTFKAADFLQEVSYWFRSLTTCCAIQPRNLTLVIEDNREMPTQNCRCPQGQTVTTQNSLDTSSDNADKTMYGY
ncbi:hypothetical protein Mapa_010479 [Marchantia paleacea]|nr:hypothetical protein Mapa_010479 [Marchantia paleacea]